MQMQFLQIVCLTAEIRISGFDLILCIDFLLRLANFCKIPEDNTPLEFPSTKDQQQQQAPRAIESSTKITSKLKLNELYAREWPPLGLNCKQF